MLFMSAVLPGMKERKAGRILNICSIGGVLKSPNISAYGVGKCAEIALTERVDVEGKEYGVRAFPVQPGTILTDMARETMNDPAAQRYTPWMLDMLRKLTPEQSARDMQRCTEYAAQIAAGKYDVLAGRYLDFGNDLDALARQAINQPGGALPMSSEQDRLERNKQTVLAFYEAAINKKDYDTASNYMSPNYKQHNPTAADGPEGLKTWLAEFKRQWPNLRAEIKHVVAEGDFVALHVYGVNGPSPNGTAVVDIFRLENGRLAEHWDVIQPIPPEASNSNSMF
jgi:predicted SnoaL-like aldol condensation-catalyzing enzyme